MIKQRRGGRCEEAQQRALKKKEAQQLTLKKEEARRGMEGADLEGPDLGILKSL